MQHPPPQLSRFEQIEYSIDDRIAVIALNRPECRNAIGRRMTEELDLALRSAAYDDRVSVIVLVGNGEHFSSGHDLGTPGEREGLSEQIQRRKLAPKPGDQFNDRYQFDVDMCLRWRDLPKPLVCAVHGYCIYHGWAVASACDVIFVAEDAQILPNFVEFFTLPYDMGVRKAKEFLFAGAGFISGAEAVQRGMANRAMPPAELRGEALRYARQAAQQPLHTLRMAKLACNNLEDQQGYAGFVRSALSYWVNMVQDMPPRKPGQKSIIGKKNQARARAKL